MALIYYQCNDKMQKIQNPGDKICEILKVWC